MLLEMFHDSFENVEIASICMENQLEGKIDPRKGYSKSDALLYMRQAMYGAVDSCEACAQICFADFAKDLILLITLF